MIKTLNKLLKKRIITPATANFETKNASGLDIFSFSRGTFGFDSNLSILDSLRFYSSVAPVNLAVNKVVDQSQTIPPVVVNQNDKVRPHPVLKLLENPNAATTQNEFMRALGIYYLVTGNAYIMATGNINQAPLELFAINPSQVSIIASNFDLFPNTIEAQFGNGSILFKRQSALNSAGDKRMRFVAANGNQEIWHIKDFNPLGRSLIGMSPLQPIIPEIQQYVNASIHNNSLLVRGATISGIFSLEDSETQLTQDQQDKLRDEIKKFYSGANNAGTAFLASKIKFDAITQTHRDMDFGELKESVMQMIVNVLKIPLPLVVSDNMAFNNVDNATLALYDNAVLPLAHRIFNELSLFLLPRYAGSEGLKINFLTNNLPALAPRRNDELNKLKDLNVLTIDEVRQLAGKEPLKSGGDQVYIPANLVPVGDDNFTEDQPAKPVAAIAKDIKIQDCNGKHLFTNGALINGDSIQNDAPDSQ